VREEGRLVKAAGWQSQREKLPGHSRFEGFVMLLTPAERAALVVESFERSGTQQGLRALIMRAIHEAVEDERRGVRTTLQLCIQVFDRALGVPGLEADLRATVRACRGLCLSSLAREEPGDLPGEAEQ